MQKRILELLTGLLTRIRESRLFVLILITVVFFSMLVSRLYDLQIVRGQYFLDNYRLQIRKTREIVGTRGNIIDRNGELLAYSELAFSIIFEDNIVDRGSVARNLRMNEVLLRVIDIVESNGDQMVQNFGIALDNQGEFTFTQNTETQRLRFVADVFGLRTIDQLSEEQRSKTAYQIIEHLSTNSRFGYGLDMNVYSKDRLLQLITLRYAISLNSFTQYIPTTLAMDVSDETVAAIMENMDSLSGVDVTTDFVRRYVEPMYFAPVIGFTGPISTEELAAMSEERRLLYAPTDIIGKTGIEQSMEEVLKGSKGSITFMVNNLGRITEIVDRMEPGAGNNVHLTIDKNLQIQTYRLLERKVTQIVLQQMRNVMNYNPANRPQGENIIIPIDDIYFAFFQNSIINLNRMSSDLAGPVEQQVQALFETTRASTIQQLQAELSPSAVPYPQLSPQMREHMDTIHNFLLNQGVINRDAIDTSDETFRAWNNRTISLYEYLIYAISQNWIDNSRLVGFVAEERYSDSAQVLQGIIQMIFERIENNREFMLSIYKYMIKDGTLPIHLIAAIVYEQEILPMNETLYNGLAAGTTNAFYWIRERLSRLELTPGQLGLQPGTASAVVTNPHTGEILALVSYPGFDNNRLANTMDRAYFNQLLNSNSSPFYNNATQERTAPGSTFKMVTATAALTENMINASTMYMCQGEFTLVTPHPRCWIYPNGHGSVAVVRGIDVSCNVFFYNIGYAASLNNGRYEESRGLDFLRKYASLFGLDERTGVEIPESMPQISNELPIASAIGQGTNNFAVSHLARYVSAISNRGEVRTLTLIDRTTDPNDIVIKNNTTEVVRNLNQVSPQTWDLVHQGMRDMILNTSMFRGMGISMAGKTGTAQQSRNHPSHGLFVGFAPFENPEIALAIRITHGYNSANAAEVGRDIVRLHFGLVDPEEILTGNVTEQAQEVNISD